MMSATEELRELLDERGAEWEADDTQVSDRDWYYVTYVKEGYGRTWVYEEPPDCDLLISYNNDLGAEDAVAATLGSEREKELESLAADMFCWLVDDLTPQQVRTWENRLEDLDVPPTWGVRS